VLGIVCAAAVALVVVQAALAESPVTRFTAADQAAAKAAVLKAADLGAGWKGGLRKATVEGPPSCDGWNPKQADLLVSGAAESSFTTSGAMVSSSAMVYKTTRMAALDWQRTVAAPQVVKCISKDFAAGAGDGVRLVSMKRLSFPRLATYSTRLRLVADYTQGQRMRILFDVVIVGRGRTLVAITLSAPYANRADADAAEVRLAKIVLSRIAA
jgi:hypothetical protein